MVAESFTEDTIKSRLSTTLLGRRIGLHRQAASTNDLAREAGRRGEPEGLVVLAEEQVAGRGRLGRTWVAPPGCCILCSVLLRPRFSPEHAFYLTIAASLAIYRSCAELFSGAIQAPDPRPPAPSIKWPNDVLIGGRKVSGVLSEAEFSGGEWLFSVVGFGINANLDLAGIGELRDTATSLSQELGHAVDRTALLARVLGHLESLYLLLQNGQFATVHDQWVAALDTIGKHVTVREPAGTIAGRALGVDRDGALVLRLDGGEERRVLAGDVLL